MSAQDDLRSLFSDFSDNDLVIDQIDAELNEALREQLANESASAAVVKSPLPDYSGAFQPTALHPADPLSVNELAWFQFPKMSEPITEPTNNFQPVPTMQPIEIKPIPDSTEPNPATVAATYLLLENFPSSPKEVFSKFMTLNTPVETTLKPSTNSFTYNFFSEDVGSKFVPLCDPTELSPHDQPVPLFTKVSTVPPIPMESATMDPKDSFVPFFNGGFDTVEFEQFCIGESLAVSGNLNNTELALPLDADALIPLFGEPSFLNTEKITDDMPVDPHNNASATIRNNEPCDYTHSPDFNITWEEEKEAMLSANKIDFSEQTQAAFKAQQVSSPLDLMDDIFAEIGIFPGLYPQTDAINFSKGTNDSLVVPTQDNIYSQQFSDQTTCAQDYIEQYSYPEANQNAFGEDTSVDLEGAIAEPQPSEVTVGKIDELSLQQSVNSFTTIKKVPRPRQTLVFIHRRRPNTFRPRSIKHMAVKSQNFAKADLSTSTKSAHCKATTTATKLEPVNDVSEPINYTYTNARVMKSNAAKFKRLSSVPRASQARVMKQISEAAEAQAAAKAAVQALAVAQTHADEAAKAAEAAEQQLYDSQNHANQQFTYDTCQNDYQPLQFSQHYHRLTSRNGGLSQNYGNQSLSYPQAQDGDCGVQTPVQFLHKIDPPRKKPKSTGKARNWSPRTKPELEYPLESIPYYIEDASQLTNNARALELNPGQHRDKCIELYEGQKKRELQTIVRTRYVRDKNAFMNLKHKDVFYEYNDYFDVSRPYQQQFTRVELEDGSPKNETRCALCAYCERPSFFELKNLCYAQHMSHLHGIYTDDYLAPNPVQAGRYAVAKNANPNRKTIARVREHECVVCPVCYNLSEVRCWSSTSKHKPLLNYLRHFKECHRIGRQKSTFFDGHSY